MSPEELFNRNIPLAHHMAGAAIRSFKRGKELDDLRQVCLMALMRASRTWREGESDFGPYASLCIRNAIINEVRAARTEPNYVRLDELPEDVYPYDVDKVDHDLPYAKEKLSSAMGMLTSGQRDAVLACVVDGESVVSLGGRTGVSKQAAHARMLGGLRNLRNILKPHADDLVEQRIV